MIAAAIMRLLLDAADGLARWRRDREWDRADDGRTWAP